MRLKQGVASDSTTYFEDPAVPAKGFADAGAEWIHVVDLDGAFDGAPKNIEALKRIAGTGLKVEFGGGLRMVENVKTVLDAGAARVIIGTKAAHDDAFVAELVKQFGGEKIAVGIDAKDGFVAVRGWVDVTERRATELAGTVAKLGVKTIIYTDIATDGMLKGPNFPALEEMLKSTSANIIASGGGKIFCAFANSRERIQMLTVRSSAKRFTKSAWIWRICSQLQNNCNEYFQKNLLSCFSNRAEIVVAVFAVSHADDFE